MKGIRRVGACPARAVAYAGKRGVFLLIALWAVPLSLNPTSPPSPGIMTGAVHAAQNQGELPPALTSSMSAISRAFKTQKPETLRQILPKDGKVFVSLRTIGREAGYYGRDQVHFIFAKIFHSVDHVRFQLREQEVRTTGNRKSTAHCVGFWTYKNKEGNETGCQLFFVLTLKDDVWSLVQIREAL